MSIGAQIRYYRLKRGWSQAKLASVCGWQEETADEESDPQKGQGRISHYETERRTKFTEDDLRIIADALGIHVRQLFVDEDDGSIVTLDTDYIGTTLGMLVSVYGDRLKKMEFNRLSTEFIETYNAIFSRDKSQNSDPDKSSTTLEIQNASK